ADDTGPHRPTTLTRLGAFYSRLKQHEQARRYLEKAVRVLEEGASDGRLLRQTRSDLARHMIREGETSAARTLLEQLTTMEAGTLGDEVIRTEALEMLSEVEQRE